MTLLSNICLILLYALCIVIILAVIGVLMICMAYSIMEFLKTWKEWKAENGTTEDVRHEQALHTQQPGGAEEALQA